MSVTKTITTSKPFYVVAGAGDLAVKAVREGTDRLAALRVERKDIEVLPAKAQTVAVTLAADVAGIVGTGYDELLGRGRSVVTRIRRQQSTKDLQDQASTTVRRSKATVTTAKKNAAATKKTAKSATTSARKTTTTAGRATKAASKKVGR